MSEQARKWTLAEILADTRKVTRSDLKAPALKVREILRGLNPVVQGAILGSLVTEWLDGCKDSSLRDTMWQSFKDSVQCTPADPQIGPEARKVAEEIFKLHGGALLGYSRQIEAIIERALDAASKGKRNEKTNPDSYHNSDYVD